jgi:hypothetical protein
MERWNIKAKTRANTSCTVVRESPHTILDTGSTDILHQFHLSLLVSDLLPRPSRIPHRSPTPFYPSEDMAGSECSDDEEDEEDEDEDGGMVYTGIAILCRGRVVELGDVQMDREEEVGGDVDVDGEGEGAEREIEEEDVDEEEEEDEHSQGEYKKIAQKIGEKRKSLVRRVWKGVGGCFVRR